MSISWGKVIGTGLTVVGAATAGVGFLAPETAVKAAEAIGLSNGENIAKIAGGALAAAGVTTVLASSNEKPKEEMTTEEQAKEAAYRMRVNEVREAELGRDLNGDGIIGAVPQGKGSDRER